MAVNRNDNIPKADDVTGNRNITKRENNQTNNRGQKTKEYKGWYNEVKNLAREYKINIEEEFIRKSTKEEWKKEITEKINKKIEEKIEKVTRNKTKLRNIEEDKYEMKQYMKKGTLNECKESLKIRLNMIETRASFKGRYGEDIQCKACEEKEETTEHILECKTYRKMTRRKIEKNEIKEDNIEIQRKIANYFKMVEKIKEENNWS